MNDFITVQIDGAEETKEAWLSEFRSGRSHALDAVYHANVGLVRRWLCAHLRRSARLSSVDVDDIVQETFAKAFSPQARASYDASRPYVPYLLAIAYNCFVDWLRSAQRARPRSPDLDQYANLEAAARTQEALLFTELLLATSRFLCSLPSELRSTYFRRYELGESQQRAAQALSISRQNLRTLERKLLNALRRELCRAGLISAARPRNSRPELSFDRSRKRLPARAASQRGPEVARLPGNRSFEDDSR